MALGRVGTSYRLLAGEDMQITVACTGCLGVASPLRQAAHNPIALTLVSTSPWLHVGKRKQTFRAGKGGQ